MLGERIGVPQVSIAAFEPVIAPSVRTQSSIAVIPVFGTLVRRTNGLEAASGLTSYSELAARLQAASVDTAVRGVREIDSPGGEAGGVFELAEHVRTLAQHKPVWAVAVDSALSAAYAIAAAANRRRSRAPRAWARSASSPCTSISPPAMRNRAIATRRFSRAHTRPISHPTRCWRRSTRLGCSARWIGSTTCSSTTLH